MQEKKDNVRTPLFFSRLMVWLVCGLGLALEFVDFDPRTKLPRGIWWHKYSFYTMQSNLLVFGVYCWLLCQHCITQQVPHSRFWKPCSTVGLSITGAVWHLLIRTDSTRELGHMPISKLLSIHILHSATPLMTLIDWFSYDRKGTLRWKDAFVFLVMPLAYLAFALMRGWLGDVLTYDSEGRPIRYWYRFLDPGPRLIRLFPSKAVWGWAAVGLNCVVLAAIFSAYNLTFVALDKVAASGEARVARKVKSQ